MKEGERDCGDWLYEYVLTGEGSSLPDEDFDPLQLAIGIAVELEHTSNRDVAKAIAKDHLVEHRFYYSFLEEMENKMKRSK